MKRSLVLSIKATITTSVSVHVAHQQSDAHDHESGCEHNQFEKRDVVERGWISDKKISLMKR